MQSDEALILFLDTENLQPVSEETFIWVITKSKRQWARSKLGTQKLREEISALRCGLDDTKWLSDGAETCSKLLGIDLADAPLEGDPLPFNVTRSYNLYRALFSSIKNLIDEKKKLIVVPAGPLTQLPFHVLIDSVPPKK